MTAPRSGGDENAARAKSDSGQRGIGPVHAETDERCGEQSEQMAAAMRGVAVFWVTQPVDECRVRRVLRREMAAR
jgi:hypothetical protein